MAQSSNVFSATGLLVIRCFSVSFGDWAGIVLLYTFFCLAMIVFGTWLIYLYSRLNWDGFSAFVAEQSVLH
jgi:hypothetical protein